MGSRGNGGYHLQSTDFCQTKKWRALLAWGSSKKVKLSMDLQWDKQSSKPSSIYNSSTTNQLALGSSGLVQNLATSLLESNLMHERPSVPLFELDAAKGHGRTFKHPLAPRVRWRRPCPKCAMSSSSAQAQQDTQQAFTQPEPCSNHSCLPGYLSGGQLMLTSDIENFPGYPKGIGGPEMMMELREQAEAIRFGNS